MEKLIYTNPNQKYLICTLLVTCAIATWSIKASVSVKESVFYEVKMVFMSEILGSSNVAAKCCRERIEEMPILSKWPLFGKSIEDLCLYMGLLNTRLVWFCSLGPPKLMNIKSIPIQTTVQVMTTVHGILSSDACYYTNAGKFRI